MDRTTDRSTPWMHDASRWNRGLDSIGRALCRLEINSYPHSKLGNQRTCQCLLVARAQSSNWDRTLDHTSFSLPSARRHDPPQTLVGSLLKLRYYRLCPSSPDVKGAALSPQPSDDVLHAPIDFRDVYAWFSGTIWQKLDCGRLMCRTANCCHSHAEPDGPTHIFFLPGELSFLREALGSSFPYTVSVAEPDSLHCASSSNCVYSMRSVDCRSFPLWPVVRALRFLGFIDYRGGRCPITLPNEFIERNRRHWDRLLEAYPWLLGWLESRGEPAGKFIIF